MSEQDNSAGGEDQDVTATGNNGSNEPTETSFLSFDWWQEHIVVLLWFGLGIFLFFVFFRTMYGTGKAVKRGKFARFRQHLQDLKWRVERLKKGNENNEAILDVENEVQRLLRDAAQAETSSWKEWKGETDWEAAYVLERKIVDFIETDAEVNIDFARNLEQARLLKVSEFAVHEKQRNTSGDEKKLALAKLIGDIQWARGESYAKRKVAVAYVARTGVLILLSGFVVALLLYFDPPFEDREKFAGLDFAMLSGAFGASFFMLASSQNALRKSTYSEISRSLEWPLLLIRLAFGAGAAAALYFFFETELLTGQLTPTLRYIAYDDLGGLASTVAEAAARAEDAFLDAKRAWEATDKKGVVEKTNLDMAEKIRDAAMKTYEAMKATGEGGDSARQSSLGPLVPNRHLALLFFWSFLAGFSERLVPNLLNKRSEEIAPDT